MVKEHVLPRKKTEKKKSEITLEDVVELGGNKKDYDLVAEVEDNDEGIDYGQDLETDTIKKDELQEFIQNLGFDAVMETEEGTEKKKKVKKVKLLSATDEKGPEEQQEEEQPTTSKKKKSKNKFKTEEDIQSNEVSSSSETVKPEAAKKPKKLVKDKLEFLTQPFVTRTKVLIRTGGPWLDQQFVDESHTGVEDASVVSKTLQYAEKLMEQETMLYKKQKGKKNKGDAAWIHTVITSGTLSDRMAAFTLMAQESPVHGLHALEKLVEMVNKKGKKEALMALDALKELFTSDLLPDDRKLRTMKQHPLQQVESLSSGNKDSRDKRILLWYYEHQLKNLYAQFVQSIKTLCHDTVAAARKKAISAIHVLLSSKPEQEKELLGLLVNKLGDPDYKTASKASHLLTLLVDTHPNMKPVIVEEVERMLYRPNIAAKAQYYAVCFMNQLVLSHGESGLASSLIKIYFSLFNAFIKKGDVDSKMLRALLTGVNRAYPFAKVERAKIEEQMDTLYKVVHIVNFQTSIQALLLLYQVTDSSDTMCERFYTALYRKLLDPALHTSPKQGMFLNLLYKSMHKDIFDARVKAFCKRLLQVCCHHQSVPFICGALVLLSELVRKRPQLIQCTKQVILASDDLDDDEEEHFEDAPEESSEEEEAEESSDEEEEMEEKEQQEETTEETNTTTKPSWVHKNNRGVRVVHEYDANHRNPLYSQADQECTWEMDKLTQHYHPTVALFTNNILKGQHIKYSGDPLEDFTLINFLNRFVYRNPKKADTSAANAKFSQSKQAQQGAKAIPANTKEYLEQGESKIPVDEKFLFQYFTQQASKKKELNVDDLDSDAGSVDDDEFDDYLEGYEKNFDGDTEVDLDFAGEFGKSKSSKKKKGADDDDDDDDEMDDEDDEDLFSDENLTDEEVEFSDDMGGMFDEEDDDDEGEDDDGEGGEMEIGGGGGFDEEDVEFSDEDDMLPKSKSVKKRPLVEDEDDMMDMDFMKSGKKKKKANDVGGASLFAAAEEFSHLMDDNTASKYDMIGSDAMANKDNASVKQLRWEADRDKWIQGKDWKQNKGRKQKPNRKQRRK